MLKLPLHLLTEPTFRVKHSIYHGDLHWGGQLIRLYHFFFVKKTFISWWLCFESSRTPFRLLGLRAREDLNKYFDRSQRFLRGSAVYFFYGSGGRWRAASFGSQNSRSHFWNRKKEHIIPLGNVSSEGDLRQQTLILWDWVDTTVNEGRIFLKCINWKFLPLSSQGTLQLQTTRGSHLRGCGAWTHLEKCEGN